MGNSVLCPTNVPDEEGFEGRYDVDESSCIGTGKFAVVRRCWLREEPETQFALKMISKHEEEPATLARVQEEIATLQILGAHPGIVSLVDTDDTSVSHICLVFELCEGGELYDRIEHKRFYAENEAKACCNNLMQAVAYIHSKGIMHRDLKPENILLVSRTSDIDVKISDFGLAKASQDLRRGPRSNSICGSDFYLAPEIIKQEEYGREVDVWAMGVITYVLLSGSLPFFHGELHKLYRQIVEREICFPDKPWKSLSKTSMDFILSLCNLRPADRPSAQSTLSHPWLAGPRCVKASGTAASMAPPGASFGSFASLVAPGPGQLHAALHSQQWGGAVAAVPAPPVALSREQSIATHTGLQGALPGGYLFVVS